MKLLKKDTYKYMLVCDECSEKVNIAIQLGEEPDYESATAIICESCLNKAKELFNQK